jgi:hypothetical protein
VGERGPCLLSPAGFAKNTVALLRFSVTRTAASIRNVAIEGTRNLGLAALGEIVSASLFHVPYGTEAEKASWREGVQLGQESAKIDWDVSQQFKNDLKWMAAGTAAKGLRALALALGGVGEIAGASRILRAPFNPSGSRTNCVNSVAAFLKSVKEGRLFTASEHVSENLGSIRTANRQIAAQTGVRFGEGQFNALRTGKETQFFVVYRGASREEAEHVAVGIVNKGKSMIYDPQTGERFRNVADFGTFTAYPVQF